MFNGRRQPSCGGTSWMTREYQVRFCERLGVKFPGPTRPELRFNLVRLTTGIGGAADVPRADRIRSVQFTADLHADGHLAIAKEVRAALKRIRS
jgi:hypothetical protein